MSSSLILDKEKAEPTTTPGHSAAQRMSAREGNWCCELARPLWQSHTGNPSIGLPFQTKPSQFVRLNSWFYMVILILKKYIETEKLIPTKAKKIILHQTSNHVP
jgi:hypothetical protein